MGKLVNIGIIQFRAVLGDIGRNLEKGIRLIHEAKMKGSQIVCLPELFSTGYHMAGQREAGLVNFQHSVQRLKQTAKENKVYIIAPIPEERKMKGVLYNSALVINDRGELEGSYAKTHLFGEEELYFREGHSLPVFDTKYGKIGIALSYDAGFPEVTRILNLKGAEMIFVPAAWNTENMGIWDLNLRQRALENILFTIGVNHVHEELKFFGKSKICGPGGDIVMELPSNEECVSNTTIDLDELYRRRIEIGFLKDRKPFLYKEWMALDLY